MASCCDVDFGTGVLQAFGATCPHTLSLPALEVTNEVYESEAYAGAIDAYQRAEFRSISSVNFLNVVQSAIMFCGITSGLLVCAGGVAIKQLTVGDAVLFLSLMAQLYGPLNWFGSYYRCDDM
jgi:ABC-type transport system involved in Fe-S cluster assembly fused permease/ATPase subunit